MDDLDRRLIALLRMDGRLPVASLAAALGVSRATVKARLDRLIEDGAIRGFTAILGDDDQPGTIRAIMLVEVEGQSADRVAQRLQGFPEARTIHSTNGRWDLVVELETSSLAEFDRILREMRLIDGIIRSETSLLLTSRRFGRPV